MGAHSHTRPLSAHLLCATVADATLDPGLFRLEILLYPYKKKKKGLGPSAAPHSLPPPTAFPTPNEPSGAEHRTLAPRLCGAQVRR